MILTHKNPQTGKIYVLATGTLYTRNRKIPYAESIKENGAPKMEFMLRYDYDKADPDSKYKYQYESINCVIHGTGFTATTYTLAKEFLRKGERLLVTGTYVQYLRKNKKGVNERVEEIMVDFILPLEAISALLIRNQTDIGEYYIKKREMREEARLAGKKWAKPKTEDTMPDEDDYFD